MIEELIWFVILVFKVLIVIGLAIISLFVAVKFCVFAFYVARHESQQYLQKKEVENGKE